MPLRDHEQLKESNLLYYYGAFALAHRRGGSTSVFASLSGKESQKAVTRKRYKEGSYAEVPA